MSVESQHRTDHDWAQQALPWLVNGTLPRAETLRLQAHFEVCAACRADHAFEQSLAQRLAAVPVVDYAPQASFAKLMQRIDSTPLADQSGVLPRARQRRPRSPWAYAFMAQTAVVAVLMVTLAWLAQSPTVAPAAEYRTLSSSALLPRPPHLQVVFGDALSIAEQRAILSRVQGQIIEGPSPVGLFLVALAGPADAQQASINEVAKVLRATPGVRFVAVPPQPVLAP